MHTANYFNLRMTPTLVLSSQRLVINCMKGLPYGAIAIDS